MPNDMSMDSNRLPSNADMAENAADKMLAKIT